MRILQGCLCFRESEYAEEWIWKHEVLHFRGADILLNLRDVMCSSGVSWVGGGSGLAWVHSGANNSNTNNGSGCARHCSEHFIDII